MQVQIIITGGTIDSVWNGSKDTVEVSEHSVLPEYFKELGRNLGRSCEKYWRR
ncbi:hypothetical protein HYW44_00875 [Candidatus Daviesbacteria bacterium]|nr:hypothetical protein [Candidatus Daviesbacteria bacterium]